MYLAGNSRPRHQLIKHTEMNKSRRSRWALKSSMASVSQLAQEGRKHSQEENETGTTVKTPAPSPGVRLSHAHPAANSIFAIQCEYFFSLLSSLPK